MARTAILTISIFLVTAAQAFANYEAGHDGGEGWYGITNDKIVTNAGFILIIFFPLFIFFASLLQWWLEKRKDRRKAEAKAAAKSQGGW